MGSMTWTEFLNHVHEGYPAFSPPFLGWFSKSSLASFGGSLSFYGR
jgi:hypothetical protein